MKKIATIAALALMTQQAMGACAANWVKTAISINGVGDGSQAPVNGDATFDTCATQKANGPSCCTAAEVNTFQDKADALVETLKTAVSTRDQYILDSRGDVLSVRDSLNSIQESITKLAGENTSISGLTDFFEAYESTIETFTEDFDTLKAGFITLQQNRVDCFNALVRTQVTIWCESCIETPLGFDTTAETVDIGTTAETYLARECSAYVTSAVQQAGILSLNQVADSLALLASALSKAADGDLTGAATEIAEFATEYTSITPPTNDLQKIAYQPGTCSTTSCDWASNLLADGVLDTDLATVGGSLTAVASRRLQQTGRRLQMTADPETESVGVDVAFPENPGNVDNDQNSAVRNGAIACAITALAALF